MARLPAPAVPVLTLAVGVTLAATSCAAPVVVPPREREAVVQSLSRQERYLKVALFVAPFFGDTSRVLLTDRPPVELARLQAEGDRGLTPPVAERVLLPGTPVWIDSVQFPAGAALLARPASAPRKAPWLLCWASGERRQGVILLSPTSSRADDLLAEVARLLTPDDPSSLYRSLPEPQRAAIARKDLLEGMGRAAAAMAWGHPDRIRVDRVDGTEEWTWEGGERRATLQDDRVVRFTRGVEDAPAGGR